MTVVSGRRTTPRARPLAAGHPGQSGDVLKRLEREFTDVQDVEFTIEDWQIMDPADGVRRSGRRAALRIAIDLVREGLITKEQALERVAGIDPAALVEGSLGPARQAGRLAGIGASGGIAVGRAALSSESAEPVCGGGGYPEKSTRP